LVTGALVVAGALVVTGALGTSLDGGPELALPGEAEGIATLECSALRSLSPQAASAALAAITNQFTLNIHSSAV
jgi:hypothetical protein